MQLTDILIVPHNNFITKITEKRRRRRAVAKLHKSLSPSCEEEHTASRSSSEKRVRFGRDSVAVYELPPVNTTEVQQEEEAPISKEQLWYNKAELNAQFLKDLEVHLQEQVRKSQHEQQTTDWDGRDSSNDATSSRGLEFHFAHNQRRKEKAEAYVRAIVDKSYAVRKECLGKSTRHASSLNRRVEGLRRRMNIKNKAAAYHHCADQIHEYCTQFTWMPRDLAIGVAAEDEAEARAVYQETQEERDEESESATRPSRTKSPRLSYAAKSA